jgi:hypothetical protein
VVGISLWNVYHRLCYIVENIPKRKLLDTVQRGGVIPCGGRIGLGNLLMLCAITTHFHFMVIYSGHLKSNGIGVLATVPDRVRCYTKALCKRASFLYVFLCLFIEYIELSFVICTSSRCNHYCESSSRSLYLRRAPEPRTVWGCLWMVREVLNIPVSSPQYRDR